MDLDELLSSKAPRTASDNEKQRLKEAFDALLEEHPDRAPGPAVLSRRMGLKNRNLNGRLSKYRRQLLREAGFGYNETLQRYVK